MTNIVDFEKIVADDKNLNKLINEQVYGTFMSIKKSEKMTPDFIDWVSPKFVSSFKTIFKKNIDKSPGTISSLLRVSFLLNDNGKRDIADILSPFLDLSIESLKIFTEQVKISKYKSIEYLKEFGLGLSQLTVGVFKNFDHEKLIERKNTYIELLLEIADIFKNVSRRRDEINFNLYEKVISTLKLLKTSGGEEKRIDSHEKRLNRKGVWYILGGLLILILLLLKMLSRMG